MARNKDFDWNINDGTVAPGGGRTYTLETIQTYLLMDIRDELQALNAVLRCQEFQRIPRYLRRIAANTAKPKRGKR